MSTKDGVGTEMWINMKEEDMAMFEHDPELLSLATLANGEWIISILNDVFGSSI